MAKIDLNEFGDALVERYASEDMVAIFSRTNRYAVWRRIWLALAESQKELGLPISDAQIKAIRNATSQKIDFDRVAQLEAELNHDVMAHLHAFAEQCPEAKPILHLGATSAFITDNADSVLNLEALKLIFNRMQAVAKTLKDFCLEYKNERCVGYTHFQVAMPTTIGRRAAYWLQDLVIDAEEAIHRIQTFKIRGVKGTTGTQASFLKLFDGNHDKVKALDKKVAERLGVTNSFALTGQVYPRKVDTQLLSLLAGVGESASKMATDLRLMQHLREMGEPFGKKQVGSSAMPFKRNPILSERICSLSRYLFAMVSTGTSTSSTQWLERSLDDSAIRRLSIPRSFLTADAVLMLWHKLASGMTVNVEVVRQNLKRERPFLLTEMLLMEGVKSGEDRQDLHEKIREHSMAAYKRVTEENKENDLLEQLDKEKTFAPLLKRLHDEKWEDKFLVGRAPEQVDDFIREAVEPLLKTSF